MSVLHPKTFILALQIFQQNPAKAKKYLNDKRLSLAERKILEAWFLLRDSKFKEIHQLLSTLTTESELILAQAHLVQGIAYNNQSDFIKSAEYLEKALIFFEQTQDQYHLFKTAYNLFITQLNLKSRPQMENCLQKMKVSKQTDSQFVWILQCEFVYYSFTNAFKKAEGIMEDLELIKVDMSEPAIATYLIMKFDYFLKNARYQDCENVLNEMKSYRKFRFWENYLFMNNLLRHFLYQDPLYLYEKNFEQHPSLFYQVKVLLHFSENNLGLAQMAWNKLAETMPHVYKPNFDYQGDHCLFSLVLDQYAKKIVQPSPMAIDRTNKVKEAISYLQNHAQLMKKEDLYFSLWESYPQDKEDLSKLERIISRARKDYGATIQSRKGCYQLISLGNLEKKAS